MAYFMQDKYAFDEDRAKAGEPVQFSRGSLDGSTPQEWVDVHYIGRDVVRGGYFVQFKDGSTISTCALRMAPRFRKVFMNLWPDGQASYYDTEKEARDVNGELGALNLIAVALPVEFEV